MIEFMSSEWSRSSFSIDFLIDFTPSVTQDRLAAGFKFRGRRQNVQGKPHAIQVSVQSNDPSQSGSVGGSGIQRAGCWGLVDRLSKRRAGGLGSYAGQEWVLLRGEPGYMGAEGFHIIRPV